MRDFSTCSEFDLEVMKDLLKEVHRKRCLAQTSMHAHKPTGQKTIMKRWAQEQMLTAIISMMEVDTQ